MSSTASDASEDSASDPCSLHTLLEGCNTCVDKGLAGHKQYISKRKGNGTQAHQQTALLAETRTSVTWVSGKPGVIGDGMDCPVSCVQETENINEASKDKQRILSCNKNKLTSNKGGSGTAGVSAVKIGSPFSI